MMKTIRILALLLMLSVCGAAAQPLPRVAPEQAGMDSRRLMYADRAIRQAIDDGEIPGAVLAVVRHGKMAYLKAYGNRSVWPKQEPMTTGTVFDLASCSKPVSTALSILILAERGELRLLDPVSRYIPDFADWKSEDGRESQTLRIIDLMTHTSGLPPYAPVAELEAEHGSPAPQALLDYIARCPRDFRPQTGFQYSCLNYVTLQHIVERVSGQPLDEFAAAHIFRPLGMAHTGYLPCRRDKKGRWMNDTDSPLLAEPIAPTERQPDGQVLRGQVHDPLARILNGGVSGNAGLFSTAEDQGILCAALQNGGTWNGYRLLSPLGVRTMRTVPRRVATLGRTPGWDNFTAYASNNGDFLSPSTYGHTGYTGTSIVIDPETDTSVILLTNAVHPVDEHSVVRLRSLVSNAVAASITDLSPDFTPLPATDGKGETTALPHTDHYYRRFLQFMDEPEVTGEDIVMLGNSLTENGGDWGRRLGWKNVRNRGIIGDDIPGLQDRLHQILPGRPARLFLLIGVNDLSHQLPADTIVAGIRGLVERIRRESPDTRLYLQSLLPINESFNRYRLLTGKTDTIPVINAALQQLAEEQGIPFINLFPLFTEPGTHRLRPDLTTDGLHLNEEGYRIWAKELKRAGGSK